METHDKENEPAGSSFSDESQQVPEVTANNIIQHDVDVKPSKLDIALGYVAEDFYIFPCNGKIPLTPNGFKDASKGPHIIRGCWTKRPEANIGLPTGEINNLFVIDLDVDLDRGINGIAEFEKLTNLHGPIPDTLTVSTPRGGLHLYFKHPKGFKNTSGKLAPGIDTRGEGGYVLAPGSSINGVDYNIIKPGPAAELPGFIYDKLTAPKIPNKAEPSITAVPAIEYDQPSEDKVASALNSIDPDCGYQPWVEVGQGLHSWDSVMGLVLWDKWSSKGSKYKPGECQNKWKSFSPDKGITIGTLFHYSRVTMSGSTVKPQLILPTSTAVDQQYFKGISECAKTLGVYFSENLTLFNRGNVVVEITDEKMQPGETTLALKSVSDSEFRSIIDANFTPMVYRSMPRQNVARLMANNCSADMSKAILESRELTSTLPSVSGVLNAPLLLPCGRIIQKGYDRATGWLITGGDIQEDIPLSDAVSSIKSLVQDINFQSPGDRSRGISAFLLPVFRFGKFSSRVPLDAGEADDSQSGKSYRQEVVAAAYGELAYKVGKKDSGVGGIDESFASKLFQGRAFIHFDNFRNKLDSPYLESYMTSSARTFGVRIPYRGEVEIDPSGSCVMLSSNGVEMTRDLANRAVITRQRKQPEKHIYHKFEGLELIEYVRSKQGYILGCVYSVIKAWIDAGCPMTNESRHDFREYCQSMDWIVQNIFHEAPLLDGHSEAKERVSDPAKTFVRNICILVEKLGRSGQEFMAGDIYTIAEDNDVKIPGLTEINEVAGRKRIGNIMKAAGFNAAAVVTIDGYTVERREKQIKRTDGGGYFQSPIYVFSRFNVPVPPIVLATVPKVTPITMPISTVATSDIIKHVEPPAGFNLTYLPKPPPSPAKCTTRELLTPVNNGVSLASSSTSGVASDTPDELERIGLSLF